MEKMILNAKDKPKSKLKWLLLSFQHVFAMFGATVLVPILTGLPISVALFTSGLGTLIYIACTKAKVPVYLGSSFAYIPVIQSLMKNNGLGAVFTGMFFVGVIYCLIALAVRFFGKGWIKKVLPPIIVGPMIMIIGLGLSTSAISNAGLVASIENVSHLQQWKMIFIAIACLLMVAMFALKGTKFMRIIPFLLAIAGGFILSAIFGLVDFTEFIEIIKSPAQWFKIPEFHFLSLKDATYDVLGTTIHFNKVNLIGALPVIPLAFVTACEHIGDHSVLSKITGEDYLEDPGLDKTLLGDGIATSVAALLGGPANTTYGENTSVVGMTKVASVWVTGLAAILAMILSFSNVFIALISAIPSCVMGGISIVLYGFIASNGLRVLVDSKIDLTKTRNLIIISSMLVIGLGGAVIAITINQSMIEISSMAIAAIVGILLNVILPCKKESENPSEDSPQAQQQN